MESYLNRSTVLLILLCVTLGSEGLEVLNGNDPGKCNQTNHGKQVLVEDREKNDLIIVCSKNNDVYEWTTIGGENRMGEIFHPGYDCSNILDNNPEAKDGLYWIHLGSVKPKQVWCDMTADGGGYMLIGRINSSVTWKVPSNYFPVMPFGDPQWASYLGDAPIVDFRVQMAKKDESRKSVADWSFRLASERLLKNLMITSHGCSQTTPGIGNIAYVKDIKANRIATTSFRCSVFGGFNDPTSGFGWNMMNSCLNKPCRRGFAFYDHHLISLQTDHSGAFSYSVSGSSSGIYHKSTAFFGCDKRKCCGCFGPVGGTGDYCGTDCTKRNGGTVVKNVHAWFWVRSSLPKKVWTKCMDYKVTEASGDVVWYKLLNGNSKPEKGDCGGSDAQLNDGIVVVPNADAVNKLPPITGMLAYRKDTKELYLRVNGTWNVVAQQDKISRMQDIVIANLKTNLRSAFTQLETKLENGMSQLKTELEKNITRLGIASKSYSGRLKTTLNGNNGAAQTKSGPGSNITQLKTELKSDAIQLKNEMKNDVTQLKTEWKDDMAQFKVEIQKNLSDLSTANNITQLKTELADNVAQLRKELKNDIVQLQAELRSDVTEIKKFLQNVSSNLRNLMNHGVDPLTESFILAEEPGYFRQRVEGWVKSTNWRKCWRASQDGWSSSTFHSNCDHKSPTLVIVRVGTYIFGGYATASWGGKGFKKAPGSLIFSLRNKEHLMPFKAPLKDSNNDEAIWAYARVGPHFGGRGDLSICSYASTNEYSMTQFGNDYDGPSRMKDRKTILAGTRLFIPNEVEVFFVE